MQLFDVRAARVIITAMVIAAAVAFIYAARRTLVLFLFAIFFAYLIEPLVEHVEAWARVSRRKGIAVVYLVIFGGAALFFFLLGPRLAHEGSKLAESLPALYKQVSTGQIAFRMGAEHGWSRETQERIQGFLQNPRVRDTVLHWIFRFAQTAAELGRNAWWLALIPILAIFFLQDGRKFAEDVLELLERRRQRQFVGGVMEDVNTMLAHFIRAQMILAALSLAAYTAFLLLMHVPFAVLLGVIGGFLELIPIVGPLVAFVLIIGIALATGYKHILIVLLFLGAWRVLQDYHNSPKIMGRHVQLHPLATLFGILIGAEIAGVVGVYLSVPAIATLRIVWRRWRAYQTATDRTALVPPGEEVSTTSREHAA